MTPPARSGWDENFVAEYQARASMRDGQPGAPPPPPFELTAPTPYRGNRHLEEELQSAIVKVWRPQLVPGARLLATNGELPGGAEQIPRAARRKAMGYRRGTPDMYAARRGVTLWLEVKIKGNYPTDEQDEFGQWALDVGHGWAVVQSVDDAGVVLRAWGMVR